MKLSTRRLAEDHTSDLVCNESNITLLEFAHGWGENRIEKEKHL